MAFAGRAIPQELLCCCVEKFIQVSSLGGEFESTPTLPLHWAAEEAWMSIKATARDRRHVADLVEQKRCGLAVAGDRQRCAAIGQAAGAVARWLMQTCFCVRCV